MLGSCCVGFDVEGGVVVVVGCGHVSEAEWGKMILGNAECGL